MGALGAVIAVMGVTPAKRAAGVVIAVTAVIEPGSWVMRSLRVRAQAITAHSLTA